MPDGTQYDLSSAVNDPDFLKADVRDKIAFLSAHDSDFANANIKDKMGYINHILGQGEQEDTRGTYEKLTAPIDTGAQNPATRLLSSVGGAVMGAPAAIWNQAQSIAQNPTKMLLGPAGALIPENANLSDYGKAATWKAIPSVLPEALGAGIGAYATGEMTGAAAGKAPPAMGEIAGNARASIARAMRDPATGKVLNPYELAMDKLLPDPNAPQTIPAKAIPKGTNFGQFLEQQKILAKQTKLQAAKDAFIARKAAAADAEAQDLITRTQKLVKPGEAPTPEDLKRAGDLTQAPLIRLQALAKFGDKLAQNEINRRLKNY